MKYLIGALLLALAIPSWAEDDQELVLYCVEAHGAVVDPNRSMVISQEALGNKTYKVSDKVYPSHVDAAFEIVHKSGLWIRAVRNSGCGFDTIHIKPKLVESGLVPNVFEFNRSDFCGWVTVSRAGTCTAFD